MTLWFDMDGTLGDLYAVEGWLDSLRAFDPSPYAEAAVLHNMSQLARYLNKVQELGCELGIVSWLSKNSNDEYDEAVTKVKLIWLKKHLKSVHWDKIHIVQYGTPKENFMENKNDILFDDEERNRNNWRGPAYKPEEIFTILKQILAS